MIPEASRTCPACGSADVVHDLEPRGFRLERCRRCGLRWRVHLPDAAELDVLYSTGFYHASPPRGGSSVDLIHRLNNAIRMREIQDMAPGRLLDIGSGKGRFLAAARGRGWDVTGVEFAPATAAAATAAFGIPVISGDFLDAPIEGTFDVITMWHVLEHLPDPSAALRRAERLLRPGGRLVVSVPNIDSTQAHLGGEAWFHLDPARHLFHFSPRSLRAMVEGSGLAVDRIGHTYPEMEFIGLIQTVLTMARFEEDLLYRFFKGEPSARFGLPVGMSIAVAAALAPAAAIWTAVAPMLQSGASIQLVATKA